MNKKIVVAALFIGGMGAYNALKNSRPVTPIILGSYIFLFVLAILDMFGGAIANLAGALSMVAVVYVLLTEVPWTDIGKFVGGSASASKSTTSTGKNKAG